MKKEDTNRNMTKKIFLFFLVISLFLTNFSVPYFAQAQTQEAVIPKAAFFLSPRIETVLVGSRFDVSIFLNTYGGSINTVELNLKFPPDKLTIIKPSGGQSFISLWVEAPTYSNVKGTASFVGGIPGGITTEGGLLTTITFRAKASGQAVIEVLPSSKVLANDGLGTNIISGFGRGVYTLNPRPPDGPKVFSETHPFEDHWYNNDNPVISWKKDLGVTDFSFELDGKPLTIPNNVAETKDSIKAYEDLSDGLWYFHIKARKEGIWGSTTHFLLHIDTTPPSSFRPKIEVLAAAVRGRVLVTFFTTDLLSGIDHYEVGIIDKTKPLTDLPAFVEAQSPYPLPIFTSGNLRVIVRALDRAGNIRDESVETYIASTISSFIEDNPLLLSTTILGIIVLLIFLNYLFGHRIFGRFKKLYKFWKRTSGDRSNWFSKKY